VRVLPKTVTLARELPFQESSDPGRRLRHHEHTEKQAMNDTKRDGDLQTRRNFLKAATYVAPVILTLKATPAHAQVGSGQFQGAQGQTFGEGGSHDGGLNGYPMDFKLRWPDLEEYGR
jgi:hypothetical protein